MGTGTARRYALPPCLRELRCRAPEIPPRRGREVQCGEEGRGWDGDGYGEEVCFAVAPSGDPLSRHGELRRSALEIPPPPGTGCAVWWGGEGRERAAQGGEGRGGEETGEGGLLDRPSAVACGSSGVGTVRSGGAARGEGAEVDR
jgi:hypothetical protein